MRTLLLFHTLHVDEDLVLDGADVVGSVARERRLVVGLDVVDDELRVKVAVAIAWSGRRRDVSAVLAPCHARRRTSRAHTRTWLHINWRHIAQN